MNSTFLVIGILIALILACVFMFWPAKKPASDTIADGNQIEKKPLDLSDVSDADFKRSLLETHYSINNRLLSINKILKIFMFFFFLSIFLSGIYYLFF